MPSLAELQQAFAAAIFDRGDARAQRWIAGGDMTAAERLEVYRNNVWHNYTEALRDVYPVVERLVGEAFFRHAARRYIAGSRSCSGDLHAYGGRFAGLLAQLPEAAGLPYLPWVARLEWLMHEAFHAADRPPFAAERLAQVPPERWDSLRLLMHPSCRLLAAPWPVHAIWQANQADGDGAADLDAGAVRLLIRRRRGELAIEAVPGGEFAFLRRCARRRTLASALQAALAADAAFDLARFLPVRMADATLVDVHA